MLAPQRALLSVSLLPLPPAPMAATFILLFRFLPRRMNGPNAVAPSAAGVKARSMESLSF